MPSGACVRTNGWTVKIDGIPEDEGKVGGTCGNFNGNRNDDIWKKDTNDVLLPQDCPGYCVPRDYYQTWR